ANLLLEVLITRLFSATMFYHFTFMAVGLAMFGVAASGVYVFLRAETFSTNVHRHLRVHAQWFAAATLLALLFATKLPVFKGSKVPEMGVGLILHLLGLVTTTALPFFFAGVVVSLALTWFRDDVNRVYAFDLAGAAIGALLCGVVLGVFGGPTAVLVAATAGLVGGALFDKASRWRWIPVGLGTALVALNMVFPMIRVGSVKWEGKLTFEKWNVFSRITVDKGLSIKIDAGAATTIHNLRDAAPGLEKDKITALALATWDTPPDKVLIIGPGGGRDVLFALSGGAKNITGVEINPLIANDVMRGKYAKANGHLYEDPRVHIVVDEGRSFVSRSDERYDMIQASLVDTWAATAAGAFALTENTLYTTEAFEDYFSHLTDRGVVTMTRFYGGSDGQGVAESPRLLILAGGSLEKLGVKVADVRKHIFFAVGSAEPQGTLVAKRTEFTPDEVSRLEQRAAFAKMTVLVSPNTPGTSQLEHYLDAGAWSETVTGALDELTPPTDDRPFFFFFKKFGDLFELSGKQIYDPGLWVIVSLGSVLGLGLIFILLPLIVRLIRTGTQSKIEPASTQVLALTYFGLVGFAFMAVEIALMQRFTLFVGHPSYSLLVVLFSVLLSTAAGAVLTARFPVARLGRVMLVAGVGLGVLATIYGLTLGDLLRSWIGMARPLRIAITGILVTPCGLLMGAMIPSAVRVLGAAKSPLVPWGWGINGAMSVIGTSIATIIAIYGGFTMTFIVGAVIYAGSGALGAVFERRYRSLAKRPSSSTETSDA
ncbi:MAG: putative Spermidine synthase-like protein, partial [Myxococcales bacterium]|nr:putative Spermidine synthase-like protein [Myxococcales bacterium]